MSKTWTPTDGYFGTLLAALMGQATRRVEGQQNSGGGSFAGAGTPVNAETALKISAVWACVKLIAEAVGCMPVNVYSVDGDGRRVSDTNHWIYKLLNHSPNSFQTRNEFFETFMINLMLAGNFYGLIKRNTAGRVISILPMMATQTEVFLSKSGRRTYVFTDDVFGNVGAFDQDSIWHVPLMPSNAIVGLSPIQYGARTMGIAIAAEDRVENLAKNGFKPTGVLMIDKVLKPDQREQIREQFSDLAEGKGEPLKVLEAGMTYQQISLAPKDVQLLETRRFSVEDICRFYGVPSILVNDSASTTSWGSGISEIKEGFYTLTLQPILERNESSITKWLISGADKHKITCEFDFSRFLRGSEASRIESLTSAISGQLLSPDEARERFDKLPPFPGDIGRLPIAQSQMIPLGSKPAEGVIDRRHNDDIGRLPIAQSQMIPLGSKPTEGVIDRGQNENVE